MILKKDKSVQSKAVNRRRFLKKAAYSAPVLVSLGNLLLPQSAYADGSGGPPGPPGGFLTTPTSSSGTQTSKKRLNI